MARNDFHFCGEMTLTRARISARCDPESKQEKGEKDLCAVFATNW